MMVLGFTGGALGGHLAGWRHPDSFPTTSMQLHCMVEMAQIAERGKLDMMFLADGNGVRQMDKPALFAANSPSDRPVSRSGEGPADQPSRHLLQGQGTAQRRARPAGPAGGLHGRAVGGRQGAGGLWR